MAQLSLPYRIALGGLLVLVVVWLLVLRGGGDVATEPLPGEAGGAAVPAAAPAPAPASAPAARAATPAPAPAASAVAGGDPSGPILAEVGRGGVALVLFARPGAVDDELVRAEMAQVRIPRVTRHVIDVERVAAYPALTTGVKVSQSPTLLVVGPDRTARSIVGLTDRREIEQAIGDARR